ncbi:PF07394 family protein [Leptospira yanagawae serovar Saopaulo str. Sao Paulo = ATCC 700523]|uniref:PF07394 family protein n=1 Tax=Leptospira yanagawae serovar Saopaulo str. Sao Paulo = ATCC 700523 TaxID=1249483 RepID=A0A5E8HEN3_9LEPT|nr:DUF1501 domain-containing protein [Leptospira yanagawae]EOQ89724.1 PF07394 family protein [Leptospira yanagawae serovar Saopaulo str. Sao Paulo = ATCC 700523]
MHRKEFLQKSILSLGMGSFLFSQNPFVNLRADDEEKEQDSISLPSKVKSVIFIEMMGGMSHVDTLDPKPNSAFSKVNASISGLSVLEPFSLTAKQLHSIGIIRSTWSEEGDHGFAQMLLGTGYRMTEAMGFPDIPHFGSVIAYAKKSKVKSSYFPSYVTIGGRGGKNGNSGFLGINYSGYHVGNVDEPIQHLNPSHGKFSEERILRRKDLVSFMNDEFSKSFPTKEAMHWKKMLTAAEEFRNSKDIDSFRISLEDEKTRARYGTTWQGKAMLLAKRLAKQEVPFIHISIGGWDTHTGNKAQITKIMKETDMGIAALLEDLNQSGIIKQTLFVLSSEFGRTPDVGSRDGRDHHPKVWSTLIGGGPFQKGFVWGETDELGTKATKPNEAVHVRDLVATIYKAAGVDPDGELINSFGRPFLLTTKKAKVIEGLL